MQHACVWVHRGEKIYQKSEKLHQFFFQFLKKNNPLFAPEFIQKLLGGSFDLFRVDGVAYALLAAPTPTICPRLNTSYRCHQVQRCVQVVARGALVGEAGITFLGRGKHPVTLKALHAGWLGAAASDHLMKKIGQRNWTVRLDTYFPVMPVIPHPHL
ncbi:hypothetical protein KBC79_01600 [Candidatus Woesebacteria bacterium]|nr:hypothetical protein [Candidatus Woesebacteria bacterium]